ncbi:MAG: polyprenyl synthetase family protein [Sulfurimonas sp.]|nr:MAG: polyprenyl synthetase family protein [Sulfurimonas sp.]
MEQVENDIKNLVHQIDYSNVTRLFDALSGGKRLRAKLVLKIAASSENSVRLAAIIELIHAASLLHDDVIDEASVRRGVPSVNATEDSKTAVMLGDVLYSKAFSELVHFESAIASCIAHSVTSLSVGEMMDVAMASHFNSDADAYLNMLYLKTATLMEAAATAAALLAQKDATAYGVYGKNLGLSFQIIDDILDIVSDEATLGKPAMNDFVEGKCTLPYIYLYDALNRRDKERLKDCHARELAPGEGAWIRARMEEHHSIEKAYALARKLSDEAITSVKDDRELVAVIETMMKRRY